MMPVSSGAALMLLTTCLAMPGRHTGEPEYLLPTAPSGTAIVLDNAPSVLRISVLYRHCLPGIWQKPFVSPNAIRT